jgi:hypothetical protein
MFWYNYIPVGTYRDVIIPEHAPFSAYTYGSKVSATETTAGMLLHIELLFDESYVYGNLVLTFFE